MDNSDDKTVKDEAPVAEHDVLRNRRRVIQGMAALPAMLTLKNGMAQAVASNLECIPKNGGALEFGLDINEGTDANGRHCVLATEASQATPPRPGIYDTGPGTAIRTLPTDTNLNGINYTSPQQACVVYVDADGNIVTYDSTGFPANGLNPVTSSCYASFT